MVHYMNIQKKVKYIHPERQGRSFSEYIFMKINKKKAPIQVPF